MFSQDPRYYSTVHPNRLIMDWSEAVDNLIESGFSFNDDYNSLVYQNIISQIEEQGDNVDEFIEYLKGELSVYDAIESRRYYC